jgi:arylsulfatase A-like enzyme
MNEQFKKDYPNMSQEDLMHWRYQRYMQDYLGSIAAVDEGVGKVLDYLDENGLTENTIVVYTSDQGFYLGEHGWFDKRFMYEESFRTPILMRYPKEIKSHTEIAQLIQNLDFAPTFLDYAGIEIPNDMQGKSFRKIVNGETSELRDAIYYTYYEYPSIHMVKRHYGVRTDRYKLIHFYYDVDEWELYDLEKDPNEMQNFYGDPAYADIQQNMLLRLKEMREKYGDSDENDQKYLNDYLEAMKK